MASRFAAVTNKEISQIIKQDVPEIHDEGGEIWFGSFNRWSFVCLPWICQWNRWKVSLYKKCKFSLSLALLYLAEFFINIKSLLFYRMVLKTKRIHNSFRRKFPKRTKQKPSKVLFVAKKTWRPFGHCTPKLLSLATVTELKIVNFVLNYLTVLVYCKTIIIHQSGGS